MRPPPATGGGRRFPGPARVCRSARLTGARDDDRPSRIIAERFALSALPVLALDLGASRIRAAVVQPDGHAGRREPTADTRLDDGPTAVLGDCDRRCSGEVLVASRRAAGRRASSPASASPRPGRSIPRAAVSSSRRTSGAAFHDVPLADRARRALGLPAVLDRDTHVAALGERGFGAARGARDSST